MPPLEREQTVTVCHLSLQLPGRFAFIRALCRAFNTSFDAKHLKRHLKAELKFFLDRKERRQTVTVCDLSPMLQSVDDFASERLGCLNTLQCIDTLFEVGIKNVFFPQPSL